MTTVRVPSRTRAGHFYDVTIGIDGTPICSCPASFHAPRITCWHVQYVKEEMMNGNTTALVPVKLAPPVALLASERELGLIDQAAELALRGGITLPPELNSRAKVAAVMLYGWELGLRPMTAVKHLNIINGRVSPDAEVMAGMLMGKEPDSWLQIVKLDATTCTMRILRPSRGINETYTVTWDEIIKAGLGGGNNAKYPTDRLRYHCTKRLLRAYAPDVINAMDGPMIDGSGPYIEEPETSSADFYNEGDAIEGEYTHTPEPEPVVRNQRTTEPQDEITAAYMGLVKERGAEAGRAVFDWAEARFPHAKPPRGKFTKSLLTAEENAALFTEINRYMRTGIPRCPDDGHESQFNEDTTLLACSICGLGLEQPEPVAAGLGF